MRLLLYLACRKIITGNTWFTAHGGGGRKVHFFGAGEGWDLQICLVCSLSTGYRVVVSAYFFPVFYQ